MPAGFFAILLRCPVESRWHLVRNHKRNLKTLQRDKNTTKCTLSSSVLSLNRTCELSTMETRSSLVICQSIAEVSCFEIHDLASKYCLALGFLEGTIGARASSPVTIIACLNHLYVAPLYLFMPPFDL